MNYKELKNRAIFGLKGHWFKLIFLYTLCVVVYEVVKFSGQLGIIIFIFEAVGCFGDKQIGVPLYKLFRKCHYVLLYLYPILCCLRYEVCNLVVVRNRCICRLEEESFSIESFLKNRIFKQLSIKSVLTKLRSILLIVSGTTFLYDYAMVRYLMIKTPNLEIMEAMKQSKSMMHGNKMKLFLLDLSFIGWIIPCIIHFYTGFFWLYTYMCQTRIQFFLEIDKPLNDEQMNVNKHEDFDPSVVHSYARRCRKNVVIILITIYVSLPILVELLLKL